MTAKPYRVVEALQNALELSANLQEDPAFALETLRASLRGIITFISYDAPGESPSARATQQLCATIRSESKYAYQMQHLPADQQFFVVNIRADLGGYCVLGGPGGAYRLTDVHLYVNHKTQLVRLT